MVLASFGMCWLLCRAYGCFGHAGAASIPPFRLLPQGADGVAGQRAEFPHRGGDPWLPDDIQSALLDENGPLYRENYQHAKTIYPLDELDRFERWRFVINLTDACNGRIPDPCCCCARATAQGAYEVMQSEELWREHVQATVRNNPNG